MKSLLFAAALIAAAPAAGQTTKIALERGETLLEIQGEGVVKSRPDRMMVTAGVVTTGATAKAALDANAVLANRLIDAVRSGGIPPSGVRTVGLTVTPSIAETDRQEARLDGSEPRITGYIARNELQIRLTDLEQAPQLIGDLFDSGANSIRGPFFSIVDTKPATTEARGYAVAEARTEAEAYADALGMRIARVLRVSERGRSTPFNSEIVVTGSRINRTPIEPGEIETKVTVWIDYALVPK